MRNEIIKIVITVMLFAGMTGIVVAEQDCQGINGECIDSSFDGVYIQTSVWNLAYNDKDVTKGFWYVLRYYPPETLNCNKNVPQGQTPTNCDIQLDISEGDPVPGGFEPGVPHYSGDSNTNHYQEPHLPISDKKGWWIITLWHKGNGECTPENPSYCETLVKSYKIYSPVNIPIPEFPTVALPIAAVIGLVFFFQHKKRKEE